MVHLPAIAQSGGNDQPMRVPVLVHLLRRHKYYIHRLPDAVQTHINVSGQPWMVEFAPFHHKQVHVAVGPISPRAAEPNRMILSGRAVLTTRRMISSSTSWFRDFATADDKGCLHLQQHYKATAQIFRSSRGEAYLAGFGKSARAVILRACDFFEFN
jgi:hypothetical protein